MAKARSETDFGFRKVPLSDKQAMVDDVFHSVARRYDLMNDLMSGGLHRAWKDALVTAANPPRGKQAFALLDIAGGTGDVALRLADKGGPGTRIAVADINRDMLAVGRERAELARRDIEFIEANAETLPMPDKSFIAVLPPHFTPLTFRRTAPMRFVSTRSVLRRCAILRVMWRGPA